MNKLAPPKRWDSRPLPIGSLGIEKRDMLEAIPTFELRGARAQDYRFAERLYIETLKPLLVELGDWNEPQITARFKQLYNPSEVKVITVEGTDVGWLQVHETDQKINLFQIQLEAPYRGRGIGAHLMENLMARAQRAGKPLCLHVIRNNGPAHAFYQRLGFKIVGGDGRKHYMRWDPPADQG